MIPLKVPLAVAAVLLLLAPAAARASDEEIQVYMDEMNRTGIFGLDLHLNYVPSGRHANVDYFGQESSQGRFRVTPEWSYGLTPNIELGAYVPLMEIGPGGRFEIGGVKGRVKWIAPHKEDSSFFWGANFELGRVRRSLDLNPWNAELKGIAGWRKGRVTLAGNINVDFTVSGPAPAPATFQLASKAAFEVRKGLSLGLESYNDLGDTHRLRLDRHGDHQIYAVIDTSFGRFDLDFGIGRGYGAPQDKWVVKVILGIPIDPRAR